MNSALTTSLKSAPPETRSADAVIENKPRCVLLAGSARGGTSWALKVLDSHPAVHGSHEPFYQLDTNKELSSRYDRIKSDRGTKEDIALLMQQLAEACIETHKPPFFRKNFLNTPAWIRSALWMSAKACPPLKSTFNYLSTGVLNGQHCIVIKNRPFPMLDRILETIHADALVLLRHPCGVVSSWLRGIRMGVMQGSSADPEKVWTRYQNYLVPMGFCEADLQRMSSAGILALNWLVDKTLFTQYQRSPNMKTFTMVYCDLVRNPLEEWSKVFEWLHLPFDSSVEAFLMQSSNPAFDIRRLLGKKYSYFSVQRSEKSPAESWRKDMTLDEIKEVMSIVTPHFPVEQYWPDSLF